MTNDEIIAIFFGECGESLEAAETGLDALRHGRADGDTVNAVFRAVHSVKGGAGAFGFTALQAFAHGFESLLSDVRDGTVAAEPTLIDLLLRALDVLSDHVSAARGEGDVPEDAAVLAELEAARAGAGGAPAAEAETPAATSDEAAPQTSDSAEDEGFDIDLDSLLDSLAPSNEADAAAANDDREGWLLHLRPGPGAMRNGGEPLLMLRELVALGGICVTCRTDEVPPLDRFVAGEGYLGWTFRLPGDVPESAVREIFDFAGDDCPIAIGDGAQMPPLAPSAPASAAKNPDQPASATADDDTSGAQAAETAAPTPPSAGVAAAAPPAAAAQGASIRIDLAKLDQLVDTVGELVIAQAVAAQHCDLQDPVASEHFALLESLTRDIQESAMAIRAQPIGSVFSRVPRILRDLAASTGKHVRLEVSGETTELDKTVIERLGEPLTHLIRNAVDHGIEPADERLAAGKNADGTLTLTAEQRSGRIVIRVADDGRGIDRARVFAKAVERGIVAADAVMGDEEIDNLIFAPGFSTAQTVSNISGRGVGMDVVRQAVKELGGRITIETRPGAGTAFVMTLPLTLAISDGMVVSVGGQTLVVPVANVLESLRPQPGEVKGLGAAERMIEIRGAFLPVVDLHGALDMGAALEHPEDGVLVVVDTEASGPAALLVDDICEQRQFVIKSLDANYRGVEGIAGATILGDGRVALIIDVDGVVAMAQAPLHRHREAA